MHHADREQAGQALAAALALRRYADPVVLALPRGGVPVGLEVALALGAPLDLIMVRKIGLPGQPELAVAAVVDGDRPDIEVNEEIAESAGLDREALTRMAAPRLAEIASRRALYMAGRATVPLEGRTAIIVDDGIATGATIRAAMRAVRRQRPARLVLAVPVAPGDTLAALKPLADEVLCLSVPEPFMAVGAHYTAFDQVTDEEVIACLARAPGAGG